MEFTFAKPEEAALVPSDKPEPKFTFAPTSEAAPERVVPRVSREPIIAGTAGLLRLNPGAVVAEDGSIQLNPHGVK